MSVKICSLRAAHGDAIIVEVEIENSFYRIVIDGGPESTQDVVAEKLINLGHIDLLVLTHYDADHIAGLIRFLEKLRGESCIIERVWANCASIVDYDDEEYVSAYGDAYKLSNYLGRLKRTGLIGEWSDCVTSEMGRVTIGPIQIDVLSPTNNIQAELLKRYRDYIEKVGLEDDPDLEENVSYGRVQCDATKSLSYLAYAFRPSSTTFMNKSSIALRIQAEGRSLLLLGDADANVVTDSLSEIVKAEGKPINVDLIKMSHHGSKANINRKLFELTNCTRFLFTTDGGTGGAYHPDRQTLACIEAWSRKNDCPITLYFNYPLMTIMTRNPGLISDEEREKFIIVDNANAIMI